MEYEPTNNVTKCQSISISALSWANKISTEINITHTDTDTDTHKQLYTKCREDVLPYTCKHWKSKIYTHRITKWHKMNWGLQCLSVCVEQRLLYQFHLSLKLQTCKQCHFRWYINNIHFLFTFFFSFYYFQFSFHSLILAKGKHSHMDEPHLKPYFAVISSSKLRKFQPTAINKTPEEDEKKSWDEKKTSKFGLRLAFLLFIL